MKDKSPQQKKDSSDTLLDLIKRWDNQHSSIERYILVWFLPFRILRKLNIEPTSRKGAILRFFFVVVLLLSLSLITTALKNEWDASPVLLWILFAFIYGIASLTYPIYKDASHNISSLGYTLVDKNDIINQTKWDRNWFSMRSSFIPGVTTSFALMATVFLMGYNIANAAIPTGSYFMIAVLGYQIGEVTWDYILVSVEAHRISLMRHKLYRLRPADTVSLHQSLKGYNQLTALNSIFMTAFLGMLALLLPEEQYLTNPILLIVLIITYFVIGLSIIVPRLSIQRIVHTSKMQEMKSIQNQLSPLCDRIEALSPMEFEELKRLDEIHEIVQSSCENFLPFSTIGRFFGTLFFPTLTFILAVASQTYLQILLERIIR